MWVLARLFIDICLFRRGPEDVPASAALLRLVLVVYALTGWIGVLATTPIGLALAQTLLDLGLMAGLLALALRARGHAARYTQTLTALAGSGTVFAVVAMPMLVWLGGITDPEVAAGTPALLFLGLVVWNLAVVAHILARAMDVPRPAAVALAMFYLVLSVTLGTALLPLLG